MKSYNYKLSYKNIIDKNRVYFIYEFEVNNDVYSVELNVRPDVINGGNELELLYKANTTFEHIKSENIWKLYHTISMIYMEGIKELVLNKINISHIKIKGLTGVINNNIPDKKKDRIGIIYIKKYCNITDIFEDIDGNTILKFTEKRLLK